LGFVSAVDLDDRTIWIADRIVVTESVSLCERMKKLTAFLELEAAIPRAFSVSGIG
jgi:hypothetical protein